MAPVERLRILVEEELCTIYLHSFTPHHDVVELHTILFMREDNDTLLARRVPNHLWHTAPATLLNISSRAHCYVVVKGACVGYNELCEVSRAWVYRRQREVLTATTEPEDVVLVSAKPT